VQSLTVADSPVPISRHLQATVRSLARRERLLLVGTGLGATLATALLAPVAGPSLWEWARLLLVAAAVTLSAAALASARDADDDNARLAVALAATLVALVVAATFGVRSAALCSLGLSIINAALVSERFRRAPELVIAALAALIPWWVWTALDAWDDRLLLLAPLAITVFVCWKTFTTIDGWLGLPVRGAGFLITIALITVFGFLAGGFLTRRFVGLLERLMQRLPLVRLLYSSTKDLLNAFVGDKRRFDKPVLVELLPGSNAQAFGFVTQESLDHLGLPGHLAVYFPQSYNFAGSLVIFPATQVRRLTAESSAVMAFIVSGGVTNVPHSPGALIGAKAPSGSAVLPPPS